jgi:signal transduction histidine kinase
MILRRYILVLAVILVSLNASGAGENPRFDKWPENLIKLKDEAINASADGKLTAAMLQDFQRQAKASGNEDCISYGYYFKTYFYTAAEPQIDSAEAAVSYMEKEKMSIKDINTAKSMIIYYYQTKGESVKAVTLCREILNTTDDRIMIADANYNIIQLYQNMNMFRQAADKAKEMCIFSKGITDKQMFHYGLANFYSLVADLLVDDGSYDEALPYLQRCDSTLKHDGMSSPASASYDMRFVDVTWGKYYLGIHDYQNAWKKIDRIRTYDILALKGHSYELEAKYYLEQKDYAKAKVAMENMMQVFSDMGRNFGDSKRKLLCADIENGSGEFERANELYRSYIEENDSLRVEADKFRTSEYAVQINLNEANLEKSEYKAKAEHYRLQLVSVILCIILAIFIVSIFMIVYLHRMNNKLKQANSMKSSFIQNISHEIRTPLNSIVGFSELLGSEKGEYKQYADIISENSDHLLHVVDKVLEISDIESCNIEIKPVNANECCEATIREMSELVPKGVELVYVPSDKSLIIQGNAERLKEIISNLLDNSFKFTEKGNITLSYAKEGSKFHLCIKDTGKGIPSDKAEWVFERFAKLDDFSWGSGLGLPICRLLTEKMGGKIYVDTSYRDGCKIDLILPIA